VQTGLPSVLPVLPARGRALHSARTGASTIRTPARLSSLAMRAVCAGSPDLNERTSARKPRLQGAPARAGKRLCAGAASSATVVPLDSRASERAGGRAGGRAEEGVLEYSRRAEEGF
jgi:hypothetical protein